MHPAKKRRRDLPPLFVNKPFRSPLRTAAQPSRDGSESGTFRTDSTLAENEQAIPSRSCSPPVREHDNSAHYPDTDLHRRRSSLGLQLTKLRQALDVAEQALGIASSRRDDELQLLITKWRRIAQEAADELFTTAHQRITNMGGLSAWQRHANEESSWWNEGIAEERHVAEADIDATDVQRQDGATVSSASNDQGHDEGEKSFNMAMMLNQMGVDLNRIGFDKHLEQWKD